MTKKKSHLNNTRYKKESTGNYREKQTNLNKQKQTNNPQNTQITHLTSSRVG